MSAAVGSAIPATNLAHNPAYNRRILAREGATRQLRNTRMDGPTARKASNGTKRRSPPPQNRSRPQSPSPAIQATVNGAKASSSAYTTRTAAIARSAYAAPGSMDYGPGTGPVNLGDDEATDAAGVMVDISAEGQPQYAYSTTLRRQPSMEQGIFPRSSSPHRASPYRTRATSNPYGNGIPLDNLDESGFSNRSRDEGVLDRVMKFGKRMVGREDYAEVRQQEEEAAGDRLRRQKETPSSIYAHKTVEVIHLSTVQIELNNRTRYEILVRTQLRVCPLPPYQPW
jgi:Ca2+-transporting ATPase